MTETPPTVGDEIVKRLLDHLDEAQLVELTALVCLENVRSQVNSAVGRPVRDSKTLRTRAAARARLTGPSA
jgi:alkylhydroperoxidase family enzyme